MLVGMAAGDCNVFLGIVWPLYYDLTLLFYVTGNMRPVLLAAFLVLVHCFCAVFSGFSL